MYPPPSSYRLLPNINDSNDIDTHVTRPRVPKWLTWSLKWSFFGCSLGSKRCRRVHVSDHRYE